MTWGGSFPIPILCHQASPYPVYTAAMLDLGIPYQPLVAKYVWAQYGVLMNMSKYGILSREPPQGKNKVQYDQWIFEVEESRKTYGEALVREVLISSLKSKVAHTICYLGYNASMSAMLDKMNTVYSAVVSYDVLM